MIVENISKLTSTKFRAIIINHNTKKLSTLALLSTIRYAQVPVLMVDCESTDGSYEFFSNLQQAHSFDLISAPFKTHGTTLDWLFKEIPSKYVFTVDSDLEILSAEVIIFMKKHMDHRRVFGAGFMNAPYIMTHEMFRNTPLYKGLLMERAWMPIALFNSEFIKEAISAGLSFNSETIDNSFSLVPGFDSIRKTLLGRLILKSPINPIWARKKYLGYHRPRKVVYDTGSKIYHYLRFKTQRHFVALPEPCSDYYVRHFTGSTRKLIDSNDPTAVGHSIDEIDQILKSKYSQELTNL